MEGGGGAIAVLYRTIKATRFCLIGIELLHGSN